MRIRLFAALFVLLGSLTPAAYAAIPDSNGVIHACFNTVNGNVRVIDTAVTICEPAEDAIQWAAQTGPPGPRGTALAYARVNADGTVDHDSGNFTAFKINSGMYCVGITGGEVHAAVVSLDALRNLGGTVQAGVFWASGCPENANDILVVTRPHAQDGGSPGADRGFYIIVN